MKVCDCYRRLEPIQLNVGECFGAKNKPKVDCDGDESRCLFYSDRRRKAKAVTNADRIRAMTDEELAEFITPVKCVDCHIPDCGVGEIGNNKSCVERTLEWLKQEATE